MSVCTSLQIENWVKYPAWSIWPGSQWIFICLPWLFGTSVRLIICGLWSTTMSSNGSLTTYSLSDTLRVNVNKPSSSGWPIILEPSIISQDGAPSKVKKISESISSAWTQWSTPPVISPCAVKSSIVKKGASFTGVTVSMNCSTSMALLILSLATTMISAIPFQFSSA